MDRNVGRLIGALNQNKMLDNAIIVFFSDNGAPTTDSHGSNYPFRGQKNTPFEGAVRVPAIIWSNLLTEKQYVSEHYFHVVDLFTTLAYRANADVGGLTIGQNLVDIIQNLLNIDLYKVIDGIDMWDLLNKPDQRQQIRVLIHNNDNFVSFVSGNYKYVMWSSGIGSLNYWPGHFIQHDCQNNKLKYSYYNDVNATITANSLQQFNKYPLSEDFMRTMKSSSSISCNGVVPNFCCPWIFPCLFDIKNDPCEHHNLAFVRPIMLTILRAQAIFLKRVTRQARNQRTDCSSNPKYNDGLWTWYNGLK